MMYNNKQIKPMKKGQVSVYTLPVIPLPKASINSEAQDEIPKADKDYPLRSVDAPPKAWRIRIGDIDWNSASDVLVRFKYLGDTARLYPDGLLDADNFRSKPDWEVGLRR